MSSRIGSFRSVQLPSLVPRDRVFFDLFNEAGQNTLRAARMLQEMLQGWPDDTGLAREVERLLLVIVEAADLAFLGLMKALCVGVEDVQATLAKAEQLGGKTIQPAQEVPGVTFGVFADAQGHIVGVAAN